MQQHYRRKQRQYLRWRNEQAEQQESCSYIRPYLRQLRQDWFARRYIDAKTEMEKLRLKDDRNHRLLGEEKEAGSYKNHPACFAEKWKPAGT